MLKIDWKLRGANRIQLDTEIQKFYQKKKKKSKRSNKPGLYPKNRIFLESERKIAVSFKRGIKKDTRVAFKRVYRLSLAFVVTRERELKVAWSNRTEALFSFTLASTGSEKPSMQIFSLLLSIPQNFCVSLLDLDYKSSWWIQLRPEMGLVLCKINKYFKYCADVQVMYSDRITRNIYEDRLKVS